MKIICFVSIVFVLVTISCKSVESENDTVLKINELGISNYEFNKNRDQFFRDTAIDFSTKIGSEKLSEWKKIFLNKCILIAHGYDLKYDTLSDIKKQLLHASNFMMVQKDGYLWNRKMAPSVMKLSKITPVQLNKRGTIYHFELLFCNNISELYKLTNGDTILKSAADYRNLKSKAFGLKCFHTEHSGLQWPFISFSKYREHLFKLNEGEVSQLIYNNDGAVYLYLQKIEHIILSEKDKENLQTELKLIAEKELDDDITKEMINAGNPKLNGATVANIVSFLSSGKKLEEYDQNPILIEYNLDNEQCKIDFRTFAEYYRYLPLKEDINNEPNLIWYINQYYYDAYLCSQAHKLGLFENQLFILDQKNFKNNLIYETYIKHEIINNIKIDSAEVRNAYLQVSNKAIPLKQVYEELRSNLLLKKMEVIKDSMVKSLIPKYKVIIDKTNI